jgi:hypothetical protein
MANVPAFPPTVEAQAGKGLNFWLTSLWQWAKGVKHRLLAVEELANSASVTAQQANDAIQGIIDKHLYVTYHDEAWETAPATPTGAGNEGGWHTNYTDAANWTSWKFSTAIDQGAWGTPTRLRGMPGDDGAGALTVVISPEEGVAPVFQRSHSGTVSPDSLALTARAYLGDQEVVATDLQWTVNGVVQADWEDEDEIELPAPQASATTILLGVRVATADGATGRGWLSVQVILSFAWDEPWYARSSTRPARPPDVDPPSSPAGEPTWGNPREVEYEGPGLQPFRAVADGPRVYVFRAGEFGEEPTTTTGIVVDIVEDGVWTTETVCEDRPWAGNSSTPRKWDGVPCAVSMAGGTIQVHVRGANEWEVAATFDVPPEWDSPGAMLGSTDGGMFAFYKPDPEWWPGSETWPVDAWGVMVRQWLDGWGAPAEAVARPAGREPGSQDGFVDERFFIGEGRGELFAVVHHCADDPPVWAEFDYYPGTSWSKVELCLATADWHRERVWSSPAEWRVEKAYIEIITPGDPYPYEWRWRYPPTWPRKAWPVVVAMIPDCVGFVMAVVNTQGADTEPNYGDQHLESMDGAWAIFHAGDKIVDQAVVAADQIILSGDDGAWGMRRVHAAAVDGFPAALAWRLESGTWLLQQRQYGMWGAAASWGVDGAGDDDETILASQPPGIYETDIAALANARLAADLFAANHRLRYADFGDNVWIEGYLGALAWHREPPDGATTLWRIVGLRSAEGHIVSSPYWSAPTAMESMMWVRWQDGELELRSSPTVPDGDGWLPAAEDLGVSVNLAGDQGDRWDTLWYRGTEPPTTPPSHKYSWEGDGPGWYDLGWRESMGELEEEPEA